MQFNRSQHVYTSPNLEAIINDAVRFFGKMAVYQLPLIDRFHGTGVYAIYATAQTGVYATYHLINTPSVRVPIYVGKAVPTGWRQARGTTNEMTMSYKLYGRLREHSRNLEQGANIKVDSFVCRFMILEGRESDLIGTVEAALIRRYKPLWNSVVDGFGNHDPGKGRYNQAKSDWDVYHPGRPWAEKCSGIASDYNDIHNRVVTYLAQLEQA